MRSDEDLMWAYRAGDDAAFEELYARYFGPLTGYLRRRLPDGEQDEAEDLAENALLRAALRRDTFRPASGSFRSWLYAIAANQRRDYLRLASRKLRAWLRHIDLTDENDAVDPAPSSAERWFEREVVRAALAELTQRQRDVILLSFWQGFTYQEIAQSLGMRRGSVGVTRMRALEKLRRLLGEQSTKRAPVPAPLETEGVQS